MTEDTSPENLRKFLESDDPALVRMGLSMTKGSGLADEMLGEILWMYMLHDDKKIRAAAKSTFMKLAPERAKQAVKDNWKAKYRGALPWPKNVVLVELAVKISSISLIEPLIRTLEDEEWGQNSNLYLQGGYRAGIASILGDIGDKRAVEPLIKVLDKKLQPWHRQVMETLGQIGDMRAVEPLIKMLKSKRSLYRESAARALDELKWKPDTKELLATYLIAKVDHGYATPSLIAPGKNKWIHKTYGIRDKKLVELGEQAVEPLIRTLNQYLESRGSDNWLFGEAAAISLGEIGDARAIEPLIVALGAGNSSANVQVVNASKKALKKLGHEVK